MLLLVFEKPAVFFKALSQGDRKKNLLEYTPQFCTSRLLSSIFTVANLHTSKVSTTATNQLLILCLKKLLSRRN